MSEILKIRGGQILDSPVLDLVKTPILSIHPYREIFSSNSKLIINNMFQEHTAGRYLQISAEKIKTFGSTCLAPILSISTQINTITIVG